MISYAQNFEDVMLHRVFRHRKSGFYIDVGAMDPVVESVTKFFYDQGWCGINIEPNEWFFNRLTAERERDINLNVGVGDHEEQKTFYLSKETGLSSFDEQNRDLFVERGFHAERTTARITTLAAICQEHVDQQIDFLKVDCEGWEKEALAGADWVRFRPTVIVVEATLPGTQIPAWSEWEPILIETGQYDMVYFDGLNRFYLRRDSPDLRTHFNLPPNFFDEFKLYATEVAEQAHVALQLDRDGLAARSVELQQRLTHTEHEVKRTGDALSLLQKERDDLRGALDLVEKERDELQQALLKTRLWAGQLSQDLSASRLKA